MPNIPLSTKSQAIATIIFLTAPALLIWIFWQKWYSGLLWYVFLWLFQYAYDIINFGRFKPPLFYGWYKYVCSRVRQRWYKKQMIANGLPVVDHTAVKITSITEFKVLDWAHAYINHDYSKCGGIDQYELLKNQFIDACKEDETEAWKNVKKQILILNSQILAYRFNIEILRQRYSEAAADFLRTHVVSRLPQLPFTRETYLADCKFLETGIVSLTIALERNETIIESMAKKDGKTITYDQYIEYIENILLDCESIQKVSYSIETITLSKLASLIKRRAAHIKSVEEQIRKSKNGR